MIFVQRMEKCEKILFFPEFLDVRTKKSHQIGQFLNSSPPLQWKILWVWENRFINSKKSWSYTPPPCLKWCVGSASGNPWKLTFRMVHQNTCDLSVHKIFADYRTRIIKLKIILTRINKLFHFSENREPSKYMLYDNHSGQLEPNFPGSCPTNVYFPKKIIIIISLFSGYLGNKYLIFNVSTVPCQTQISVCSSIRVDGYSF